MIMSDYPGAIGSPVNFARGGRDYVNSVDLMHAAPVVRGGDGFRFRFFGIVQNPGCWVRADDIADKKLAKAELRLEGEAAGQRFFYVCPDETAPLVQEPDFDFTFDSSKYNIENQILTGPLQGKVDFWPQLIEAIRYAGSVVYPGMVWYVVGISGNAPCLEPVEDGSLLSLDIQRAFGQRNMVPFSTSAGIEGRILTIQKPDD